MEGKLFIDNCFALSGGVLRKSSVLISDGRIEAIGIPAPEGVTAVDARGGLISYGFADIHVHFREPGNPEKETILSGSMAAARGGYTTVCAMPNLDPVPDSLEHLEEELRIIRKDAVIQVLPYCSITKDRKGLELVDIPALKPFCAAFSDDGSGVQDEKVMREAFRLAAENGCIIAAHCEDNSLLAGGYIHDGRWCAAHGHKGICSESEWRQIERDLRLCEETGCRYHVCHISSARSVELIREAKARGLRVSCETAPHYLVLCEDQMQEDGRFKMNPPLRSAEDREALIEGLVDGTIDAIATDHAPHTAAQKSL
ncbi:MAG: dihydroorotase, partial [Bacteroidales bacterium]|nr:dihydroorotase [Bacteroidales bacterium]